jgi:hypothetical protein
LKGSAPGGPISNQQPAAGSREDEGRLAAGTLWDISWGFQLILLLTWAKPQTLKCQERKLDSKFARKFLFLKANLFAKPVIDAKAHK